ncbi:dTMP kinase [Candidatus Epulonipiscium viviparus]|uniref:dTMP kinase n=1 Tax=Candidatus Epulonipiscium viviparus TaxID=420336 RepID=UPI00016BFF09|nr:dTMP kinase [Candidatus Epulopiscium viviparus]
MNRGLFIAIEGGEGSGKTTLCSLLKTHFEADNIPVIATREPGGIESAESIRDNIFQFDLDAKTDLLLYLAARREHLIHTILPALNAGKLVLSDRFYLSTLAYQGYASNLDIDIIQKFNNFVCDDILPDLNIIIDLPPNIGLSRKGVDINRFDLKGLDFHTKVYEGYLQLSASIKNVYLIDGTSSLTSLEHQIYSLIKSKM